MNNITLEDADLLAMVKDRLRRLQEHIVFHPDVPLMELEAKIAAVAELVKDYRSSNRLHHVA